MNTPSLASLVALTSWLFAGLASPVAVHASSVGAPGVAFNTPVTLDNLDPAAFAAWVDGAEKAFDGSAKDGVPQAVVFTTTTDIGSRGVTFGDSKTPGPRHLRIGFKAPVPVGSVMVKGGGSLSVLKPGAAYPGDLNNDADWLPASRLQGGEVTNAEVVDGDFAVWVLPPGTATRALRFTHDAKITNLHYAGNLDGALVLKERFGNVAPQAVATASVNPDHARLLINGAYDGWKAWENQAKGQSGPVISPQHPEWIVLGWREPVRLTGLVALWSGVGAVEVQTVAGSADGVPSGTDEAGWRPLGEFGGLKHGFPSTFLPNRLDFGREVTTRALRLRVVGPVKGGGAANTNGGSRIWLGEIMALTPLGSAPLQTVRVTAPAASAAPNPPIPIKFTLKKPGYVTLVIEKADGFRVRNLISETLFPAGENTAWWDGTDDLGRDVDAVMHGLYKIPARFVEPGEYRVRGLVRDALKPSYEFSVYATGNPPWNTADMTGAWLANHSAPQAAAFVPAAQSPTGEPTVYLGSYVAEGTAGLAWVDLDGRKRGGKKWIGGNWTGAPFLAANAGPKPVPGVSVYVASAWDQGKKTGINELRLTAITADGDKSVLKQSLDDMLPGTHGDKVIKPGSEIGGLAVNDGLIVVSLVVRNALVLVDASTGKSLGTIPLESPHGVAFDAQGRLLALSGTRLVRFDSLKNLSAPPTPRVLVSAGLEAPVGITLDAQGNIYVGDRGNSHQVKVFSSEGKFVRAIGHPGAPKAGPYDPLHMQNPAGLAIDSENRLWVTEQDFLPKRVSVWTPDGKLVKAFYGPAKYGGGGELDPLDKTRFYYADEGRGAMEFKLDWARGTYELTNVYYRPGDDDLDDPKRVAAPETALYHDGRRYFTNCYNNSPTGGSNNVLIYADRGGIAKPVAALGRINDWPQFQTPEFAKLLPEGFSFASTYAGKRKGFFIWSDTNGDGQIQPEEVATRGEDASGITVMPDLAFCVARADEKALRYVPTAFGAGGVPVYDITKPQVLAEGVKGPGSSGGSQMLVFPDGHAAITLGVAPFDQLSISGTLNGKPAWSYPNLWPGLHASHRAPRPDRVGELIGMTRLPGGAFDVAGSDAGPFWALHSNHGRMAFFTADGLFVGSVFSDMRSGNSWRMPKAERGMDLSEVTLGEENFWPTLTNTSDGKVYLIDGARSAIVRIDGFDTIRRLPDVPLTVTKADLVRSRTWRFEAETARQREVAGGGLLRVALRSSAPVVDGKVDDWPESAFVTIDKSGSKAYFNATSKPYDVSGAVAVAGDRLYAAWRTDLPKLLVNSGEVPMAPFKTGGALDLMVGADPTASAERRLPAAGDERLLVTMINGKPKALLYRAVVPGTKDADKVPFTSPLSTITMDRVDDVTTQIQFAGADGNYEISIPLSVLGLRPANGQRIQGDIGILRGSGNETIARTYWHNKATGITADVPSEAALTPSLWGVWEFKTP